MVELRIGWYQGDWWAVVRFWVHFEGRSHRNGG